MANKCFTEWIFTGEKHEIDSLFQVLKQVSECAYTDLAPRYDYSKQWLGNLIAYFGKSPNDYDCAGEYVSFEITPEGNLQVHTVTDWNDMEATWKYVVSQYKTLKYYYYADERAASGVWSNDAEGKFFPLFEIKYEDCSEPEEFYDKTAYLKRLSEIIGKEISPDDNTEELVDEYNKGVEEEDRILITEVYIETETD